ncbi:MAG TPA: hypothetical protein VGP33_03335 [Chloroflexota bacterium]|nr:hypothetical protein [Chloroflexota bacterium]
MCSSTWQAARYTLPVFRRVALLAGLLLLCLEVAGLALLAREGLRLGRSARAIPAEERAGLQVIAGQSMGHLDPSVVPAAAGHFQAAADDAQRVLLVAQRLRPLLAPALRRRAAALEYRQATAALTAVVDGGALAGQLSALGTTCSARRPALPGRNCCSNSAGSSRRWPRRSSSAATLTGRSPPSGAGGCSRRWRRRSPKSSATCRWRRRRCAPRWSLRPCSAPPARCRTWW